MFLHQTLCAETHFYSNQFLHKPALFDTNLPLHRPPFTPTSSYTNEFLHTSFYTHQLFDQPAFTQTTSCTNQLLQTSFYTNQLLHTPDHISFYTGSTFRQTTFCANHLLHQPALHNPCFGACRPKARGLAKCRRLFICPFVLQYIKLVASILSLRKNRGSSPVNYDYYNLHYLLVVS